MKMNKKNKKNTIPDEELQLLLNTNKEQGLTNEEVIARRQKFGPNLLVKQKKEPFIVAFIKTLIFEMMSLLLLVTGLIGLALAIYENIVGTGTYIISYIEAIVLLSIDIINGLFGTIQERKSNNAIDELEKMTSPMSKVLREGKIIQIPSSEVVIGDVIIVEAGDSVSADAILFFDSHLKVSEAILTGESEVVLKDANFESKNDSPIGDQKNKIFSGTSILNGKGYGIVCGIGNNTEIGKIADLLNNSESMLSPLQYKLQKLGKILGIFGIILTILTFVFSLLVIENVITNPDVVGAVQSSLLLAISLAAIAIPEGLTAIVTIVLSIGVKKMTSKHALIKKLPSVETLGSTSVICSDKTGTLTMNKMAITKLWTINDDDQYDIKLNESKKEMLIKASLCTDAVVDENPDIKNRKTPIGDPTEIAILELAIKNDISILNLKNNLKRIGEIPFDSNRKLMSTINEINNKKMLIVKGAPDVVFKRCKKFNSTEAQKIYNEWSDRAIRVLAIAQKEIKSNVPDDINSEDYEFDLDFIGLIGMIDPPREEVKISIKECISAGIKPVMITGDHLNTAKAIAKELGIITNEEKQLAITGVELDKLSDEEFFANIEKYSVYARVNPENKIRIVQAWQSKNQVVAMTGDGVNDAPALKAADIGCAMGITGTDVSKQAADMILMDDNFSTIVESVKLGRNIYENIRRITLFLLSSNVTGIFSIVFGMVIFYLIFEIGGWGKIRPEQLTINGVPESISNEFANYLNSNIRFQTTITTILILIHHLIIETFPGVALGAQLTTTDLMNQRPISKYESIFARGLTKKILLYGLLHGVFTVIAFIIGYQIALSTNAPLLRFYYGIIATFLTLSIGGVLKSIVMCSSSFIFKQKFNESKWIYLSSSISILLILIIILIPQLTWVCVEKHDIYSSDIINFLNENNIDSSQNQELENTLFKAYKNLSGNIEDYNYANWAVYLVGIGFGILTLLTLELLKYIENSTSKEKRNKIVDFELIQKPEPFSFKKIFSFKN
ncbi:MAG: cation-translocating P-type ATPase [Mycoplasma sp.]|nr:cation-translocating P-type ATPase [Mycoplasma sp.]